MLHCPQTNERTCPAETCLAMNSNGSRILWGEMLVGHFKEGVYYVVGRSRPVNEKQIVVVNAVVHKVFLVVLLLVQPDDP